MRHIRINIQAKVLGTLLVVLALSFVGLIVLQSHAEYDHVLKVTHDANRNQTALIASQVRVGIVKRDEALIESAFFDLVYNQNFDRLHSEVTALRVLAADGVRLKSFESLEAPNFNGELSGLARLSLATGKIQERAFGKLKAIAAPVHPELEDSTIGAVVIAWDSSNVEAEVWASTVRHSLFGGVLAAFVIALLLVVVRNIVVRPLHSLAQHVSSIRKTGQLHRISDKAALTQNDEIGTLARGLDLMIDELANAREELVRAADSEIRKRGEQLDAAMNGMSQGLCMFDADNRLIISNRQFQDIYNLPKGTVQPGLHLMHLLEVSQSAGNYPGRTAAEVYADRQALIAQGEPATFLQHLSDGRIISVSFSPMANGGWVATHEDITERRKAEVLIEHMAHHDALTDLPNRVRFREELTRAIARIRGNEQVSVLCLDLDHFKSVNDTLGHPIGDALLKQVAERLRGCIREQDTVARLSGDEFAIVQVGVSHARQTTTLAERIIEILGAPYELDGHQIVTGTSIGISIFPNDATCPDLLLKNADMALYRSKVEGRGTYRFFEPEMDAKMQARRALELDLRKALSQGEFEVYYQPFINLEAGEVSGFEALLRWKHPERGSVAPDDFIPLAEEIGLIGQIGAWVLKQACAEAATWNGNLRIAVNLSPSQFKNRTLVQDVTAALKLSGLPAHRLELEITEAVMLQDTDVTLGILHELRALGVHISMDDFGTGYSSLSYLRRFPFDKIKIDQSFIRDITDEADSLAIVRAVTGLSTSLGMTTTAEGVETKEQLDCLRLEGCTEVQGYYFSRPRPAADLGSLLPAPSAPDSNLEVA